MAATIADTNKVSKDNKHYQNSYYERLEIASQNIDQDKLMKPNWVNMMIDRIESVKKIVDNDLFEKLHPKVKEALEKYCVNKVGYPGKLFVKKLFVKKPGSVLPCEIIPLTETFPIIMKAHLLTRHGGIAAMANWLSDSNLVVSSICLTTILEICKSCPETAPKERKSGHGKDKGGRLNTALGFIDIVDMSKHGNKDKLDYLLIYQDINTKFLQLRPVSSVDLVESTTNEVMHIFSDMGPPKLLLVPIVLKDTFAKVLEMLNKIFRQGIKMMNNDDLLGRVNNNVSSTVETAISNWLEETECMWSIGCYIVQWDLNNTKEAKDGKSAFERVFGKKGNGNLNSADALILDSIDSLTLNHSDGQSIDDFISENPILEMEVNSESI